MDPKAEDDDNSSILKAQSKINWGERRASLVSSPDQTLPVILNLSDLDHKSSIKFDI